MRYKTHSMSACDFFAQYRKVKYPRSIVAQTKSKHPYRSVFTCDRDRVMYTSAFRRLASKTQIFKFGMKDNIRTRLTHTLEVSQIARAISTRLGLDLELTEAIALAHDIGHTPFGHVGERSINDYSIGRDKRFLTKIHLTDDDRWDAEVGFKHNLQGVRTLETVFKASK